MPFAPVYRPQQPSQQDQIAAASASALQDLGRVGGLIGQTREQVETADKLGDYFAQQHPDIMTEDRLKKFMGSGLSAKKALLGEMHMDVIRQFDQQKQDLAKAGLGFDIEKFNQTHAQPVYNEEIGGFLDPLTHQVIPKAQPAREPAATGPVMSPDGKFFWDEKQRKWNQVHQGGLDPVTAALMLGGNPSAAAAPAAPVQAPAPAATPAPASLPTASTKAEFDALPPGTRFTGADGKTYTKPR